MTDHVVTHRIQESPDDNGKTSANITSYLREAIIKKIYKRGLIGLSKSSADL